MSKLPSQKLKARLLRMIENGTTLSRIAELSGVDRCTLHGWLFKEKPRGIGVNSFDRLCEMLDWDVCPKEE